MSNEVHFHETDDELDPALAALFQVNAEASPVGVPVTEPVEPVALTPENEPQEPTGEETDSIATEEVEPFTPVQKPVKFTITRPVDSEAIPGEEAIISFLRNNPNSFLEILERHESLFQNINSGEIDSGERDRQWITGVQTALTHVDNNDHPRMATEREGSDWVQTMMHEGRYIGPSRPKIKLSERPTKSDIESFLFRKSGMGATHEFPMPHTGIWIRLRTPTAIEVANMIQKLQTIIVRLGRDTKGQAFSNRSAIFNNALTDLALSCVTHSNMAGASPADLEHRLSSLDEPSLHHGLISTMFPSSFNYSHPCIADVSKCIHVETAKLDMFALTWYDSNWFTKEQKALLGARFSRLITPDELDKYRQSSLLNSKPIFWFNDLGVRLRVPTIAERRDAGSRWIDSCIEATHSIFNEGPGETTRNAYIYRLGNLSNSRQYAHWIDAIYSRDGEGSPETLVTEDADVIDTYLSDILSDPQFSTKFENMVLEFIDSVINTMVAITSWNCTQCDSAAASKFHERFPHLIPLDIVSTFFTLAGQRVNR